LEELKAQDHSTSSCYNVLAVASADPNTISLHKLFNNGVEVLCSIIHDLPHPVTRLAFLTAYDLLYRNTNNQIGLISLSVHDLGLVCK
jgi:WD40 repeat protein